LNWLTDDIPTRFTCEAKIRYLHHPEKCQVEILGEDRMKVEFEDPQYGVAPGQAVVLYSGARVLGGGWIL